MTSLEETYDTGAPPIQLTAGLAMVTIGTIAWVSISINRLMALQAHALITLGLLMMITSLMAGQWLSYKETDDDYERDTRL